MNFFDAGERSGGKQGVGWATISGLGRRVERRRIRPNRRPSTKGTGQNRIRRWLASSSPPGHNLFVRIEFKRKFGVLYTSFALSVSIW